MKESIKNQNLLFTKVCDAHDEVLEPNLFNAPPPLPLDAPKRPKDNRYKEQYGIILICESEDKQRLLFEQLKNQHDKVRLVNT